LTLWSILGWLGLFAGARCCWYRPGHTAGYLLGIAGGVLAILMLVLPISPGLAADTDVAAVTVPFKLLESDSTRDLVKGWILLAPMIGIALAALLCLCNAPITGSRASRPLAGMAATVLLLGALVGAAGPMVAGMCFAEKLRMMVVLSALAGFAKFGAWFGGLLMIVPAGAVDLLIGRPPTGPAMAPVPMAPSPATVIVQQTAPPAPTATPEARLEKLTALRQAGLINEEEYEKRKQQIISSI